MSELTSKEMTCAHGKDVIERCPDCEALVAAGKGSGFTPAAEEWRCFFCSDVFVTERDARLHFGGTRGADAACQIKIAGEFALLDALRNAEDELQRYRNEDSDILRLLWSTRADHAEALRREEEKGYARGLEDAKEHPETLGLTRAAPEPPCDAAIEAAAARIETELSLPGNEPESDPSFVADLRALIAYARAAQPPCAAMPVNHRRRVVGHASGWQEQMDTCICGNKWPCPWTFPSTAQPPESRHQVVMTCQACGGAAVGFTQPPPADDLRAALVHAVEVIQTWHNMNIPRKEQSDMWDIYWRKAPEMQPIRSALTNESSARNPLKRCPGCGSMPGACSCGSMPGACTCSSAGERNG